MTRILTNLRIDEVSAVIKGSNPGAQVLIRKSDDAPLLFNDIMKLDDDNIDPNDTPTPLEPKLQQMVNAMIKAVPSLKEEHALFFLLHTPHGRALAQHLNSLTKKETPMQTDIFKLHNIESVVTIAKHIIDNGASEISEFDFYRVVYGHAQMNKRAGESDAKAFNRVFETPEIRRAYGIVKGYMDIEPVSVEIGGSVTADDSKKAYEQLYKMAEEMRRKSPTLTIHQAFARVFSAEENRKWASAATRGR
jgi:hypothetical protein